jgi:hypothetical protein
VSRHPVYGSAYTPEQLCELRHVFDEAWAAIEPESNGDERGVEALRTGLATMVMELANDGVSQPDLLRLCAIRQFCRHYRLGEIQRRNPETRRWFQT